MSAYGLTGCSAIRDGLLDAEEQLIWMEYADTHTHAHTHEVIQKEIFTNDKNCHRNGDIRREICLWGLYVAYTLQKL